MGLFDESHCATPLSDGELIDFLEQMRNATFGVVTTHNNKTYEDNSGHDSLSYFVYINLKQKSIIYIIASDKHSRPTVPTRLLWLVTRQYT